MNSINKRLPAAQGKARPIDWQAARALQSKLAIAQPKVGVFAQSVKSPVAPPAYHPQATPRAAQPQMAPGTVNRKIAAAPPVYHPQPVPKVLQTKSSLAQSLQTGKAPRQPVAPPVYRPETKKTVQPKAHPQVSKAPIVPSFSHSRQQTPQKPIGRIVASAAQLRPATPTTLAHPRPNQPQPHRRQSGRGLSPDVRVIQRMEVTHSSSQFTSLPSGGSDESGPVKTSGGTWFAREYVAKMGHEDPSARGLHIRLEFHPEYPTDATKIVLVQTVMAFKNDDYCYVDESVKNRSRLGVSIDQSGESISPVYVASPKTSASSLGSSSIEKGAGGHGYRYRNSLGGIWKVAPAWLVDNPHLRGVESFSQQSFETTAIAVEGNDARAYYGSVRWGWTWKPGGTLQLIPLSVISLGSASEVFRESAKQWNLTKTSGGRVPLQLPEVRPRYSKPAPKPPIGLDPQINNRFAPHDDL